MKKLKIASYAATIFLASVSTSVASVADVSVQTTDRFGQSLVTKNLVSASVGSAPKSLVVFLPGTGEPPTTYRSLLDEADNLTAGTADRFDVVGLEYDNGANNLDTIGSKCSPLTKTYQAPCYGQMHNFSWDETPYTVNVNRTVKKGVVQRLVAVLNSNEELKSKYLSSGVPVWSKIILMGHSQGAGTSAFAATKVPLRGVVTLAGTCDPKTVGALPAVSTWINTARPLSSATKYSGLRGSSDLTCPNSKSNWPLASSGSMTVTQRTKTQIATYSNTSSVRGLEVQYGNHSDVALSSDYKTAWKTRLELAD